MNHKVYVLAHNIRSMHNIGSIFRTSDGAGVSKIYLTGYSACPPRKEITKTAIGAEEFIPWEFYKNPIDVVKKLKKEKVHIYALERTEGGESIFHFKPKYPCCLIVGNEIEGVPPELLDLCDAKLEIPMRGIKESLNVSVAFGIGIYAMTK
ncbi:TrmH family RNA methyltransferase [Candidatus Peregrinibacteria bacterium]|nr:TrmH family RNA methyltransferase [Candidatus Peregrinibacteria bacterium]